MIRYIPDFILHKYSKEHFKGFFYGFALFFDVAGFTNISTEFQKYEKKGAEALSLFLDEIFHIPIEHSKRNGGFVSIFAGDAVCILFPDGKPLNVLKTVTDIYQHFLKSNSFECDLGKFDMKIRQTVTYGKLSWQIFTNNIQNEYVFFGETIQEMATLSENKKDVIFSKSAAEKIGETYIIEKECGYLLKDNIICPEAKANSIQFDFPNTSKNAFLVKNIQNVTPENEIRSGAYCFASLKKVKKEKQEEAVQQIADLSKTYGGFINKLDATDKGLVAIILFGLPKTEGNTLRRICNFACELSNKVPVLALGISCGSVYAGYTGNGEVKEYTALGHPVNLSARLMGKAKPGEVLTDHYLQKELFHDFEFEYIDEIKLKGISYPIKHYLLKQKIGNIKQKFQTDLIGREKEIDLIQKTLQKCLKNKTSIAFYIAGDAGVGKSRLISEIMDSYQNHEYHTFHLHCDSIKKMFLEPIKQLIRQFFYFDPTIQESDGIKSFRLQWQKIAKDDSELNRIESIIASLLGYEWENSIWDLLPGEEKQQQLKEAFSMFIKEITKKKPVLIHLDDPQWIDELSREYLQYLSTKEIAPVIIISACRYSDEGKIPDLKLENFEKQFLELTSLSADGNRKLIESLLKKKNIPKRTIDLISNKTSGNPFFAEQIVSYLLENNKIDQTGKLSDEFDVSSTFKISDIIGNRIDRLSKQVRECVYNAAVLGMEFDVNVLSKMLNSKLNTILEGGESNRIWQILNEIKYIFSHILIRDNVYERMMTSKLKKLHKIAAESMETIFEKNIDEHSGEIGRHYEVAECWEKAVDNYFIAGNHEKDNSQYKSSSRFYKQALHIHEKIFGTMNNKAVEILCEIGLADKECLDFQNSLNYLQLALDIQKELPNSDNLTLAKVHNSLGQFYLSLSRYKEARENIMQSLDALQKSRLEQSDENVIALLIMGCVKEDLGEYDDSIKFLHNAYAIQKGLYHYPTKLIVTILGRLGKVYQHTGNYEEALKKIFKALKILKKISPNDTQETSFNYGNISMVYMYQGNYIEALKYQKLALAISSKILGDKHPATSEHKSLLGSIFFHLCKYEQAEIYMQKALEDQRVIYGIKHRNIATLLSNLGVVYDYMGEYSKALEYDFESLEIASNLIGNDHPYVANTINNIGLVYNHMKEYKKSLSYYLKSLKIKEKAFGEEHIDTLTTKNNIGRTYTQLGDYDKALELLNSVLKQRLEILGELHSHTSTTYRDIGDVYIKTHDFDHAYKYIKKSLTINQEIFGKNNIINAKLMVSLSCTMIDEKQFEAKIDLLEKATKIFIDKRGIEDFNTQNAILEIIKVCKQINDVEKTMKYEVMLIKDE